MYRSTRIRQSQYLNNRIEQDHRRIKRRICSINKHRRHDPVRDRDGPPDAQTTGEARLQSGTITRRVV